MVIDTHVHVAAFTAANGGTSPRQLKTLPFKFMRWRLGMTGQDSATELQVERKLVESLDTTPELDAAVVLAFDAVYREDGSFDQANTHLHVTNDSVIGMCQRHSKFRFGASVHPFRKDALRELERCVKAGAVLCKWLPIVQGFSPADPKCIPFYEAMAHHKLPLLSHTGGEKTLIRLNDDFAPPRLLEPALKLGVTVIAAHCGTSSAFSEPDYLPEFIDLCRRYENLFGDTAALCLPTRCYAFDSLLNDPVISKRIVHGSDWPVIALPPARLGFRQVISMMGEKNWLRRDVLIKQRLGFDDAYWHRAAKVLKITSCSAGRDSSR